MNLSAREYNPAADYPLVAAWYEDRSKIPLPPQILPKLGTVIERDGAPVCAMWVYMDNSVGVAILEHFVAQPGQTTEETREAAFFGINYLRSQLHVWGYGVLIARAQPAIARVLVSGGFIVTEENLTGLCIATGSDDLCPT